MRGGVAGRQGQARRRDVPTGCDGAGAGSRWTGPAPPIGPGSAASFTRARPARGTATDKGFSPPRLHPSSSSPRHDVLARARRFLHTSAPRKGGRRRIRVSVLPASTPPPPPPSRRACPCPAASFTRARPARGTATDKGFSPPASTPPPPPPVTTCLPVPGGFLHTSAPRKGTATDKGFCPPRLHASSSSPSRRACPCPAASFTRARPARGRDG